jgi:hypothetical protein
MAAEDGTAEEGGGTEAERRGTAADGMADTEEDGDMAARPPLALSVSRLARSPRERPRRPRPHTMTAIAIRTMVADITARKAAIPEAQISRSEGRNRRIKSTCGTRRS